MAKQLRNYNYKDKNVIISLFNENLIIKNIKSYYMEITLKRKKN